ncbi:hypothetical protein CEUSTIGMA_g1348.t1 [Chlamydomonas eustigma]|uniref:J domain-containing protein n=1 Tax=Chlamydomonas eustigma TaxID=1157962 RepID=A0A250WST2_9CHLO|nr:hypothetical protein CEUSTIGMA_g1348.t1 [Chlamydomonas eustigma]|eukprot:GAX73898.1 hypothetical protein CEUSTIGMA_g1348.t1 [Chlamydomonas eustigma]
MLSIILTKFQNCCNRDLFLPSSQAANWRNEISVRVPKPSGYGTIRSYSKKGSSRDEPSFHMDEFYNVHFQELKNHHSSFKRLPWSLKKDSRIHGHAASSSDQIHHQGRHSEAKREAYRKPKSSRPGTGIRDEDADYYYLDSSNFYPKRRKNPRFREAPPKNSNDDVWWEDDGLHRWKESPTGTRNGANSAFKDDFEKERSWFHNWHSPGSASAGEGHEGYRLWWERLSSAAASNIHRQRNHNETSSSWSGTSSDHAGYSASFNSSWRTSSSGKRMSFFTSAQLEHLNVLGLSNHSKIDKRAIKVAYHEIAKKYHPDMHRVPAEQAVAQEKFKQAAIAYESLMSSVT